MDDVRQVIFAPQAGRDLESAVRYVARHAGAQVAERFGLQLLEKALSLARLPERGRIVPELGPPFREIIYRSYRIVYRVSGSRVEVIRFWHAARGAPQIDSDEFRESGAEK